jgi:hypothetical protein
LRHRWPLVCNGAYLRVGDLARSPLDVTPLAGHVAGRFRIATREGFDVNPVTWWVLAHHGVALRGPARDQVEIHADDGELRRWVLGNLNGYWRRWASRARPCGLSMRGGAPRRVVAFGVLGAPRLHYTLATGQIVTKEAVVDYAVDAFGPEWRCLIAEALAYWHREPSTRPYRRRPHRRQRDAVRFVGCVIDAANRLMVRRAR